MKGKMRFCDETNSEFDPPQQRRTEPREDGIAYTLGGNYYQNRAITQPNSGGFYTS